MTTAIIAPTRPIAIQPTATPRARAHTWTITASLCAARAEADGSINLLVADPTGRPHRQIVAFPAADDYGQGHPVLRRRAAAARAAFLDEIVVPSFEGYVMLYGTARITLALPGPRDGGTLVPSVIDFTLA